MSRNLFDLIDGCKQDLCTWAEENWPVSDSEVSDQISEIADSSTPCYHGELLDLAAENNFLATDEPEIIAFDGSPTPINCIAGNVYCHIEQELHSYWRDTLKDEMKEKHEHDDDDAFENCKGCGPTLNTILASGYCQDCEDDNA